MPHIIHSLIGEDGSQEDLGDGPAKADVETNLEEKKLVARVARGGKDK